MSYRFDKLFHNRDVDITSVNKFLLVFINDMKSHSIKIWIDFESDILSATMDITGKSFKLYSHNIFVILLLAISLAELATIIQIHDNVQNGVESFLNYSATTIFLCFVWNALLLLLIF